MIPKFTNRSNNNGLPTEKKLSKLLENYRVPEEIDSLNKIKNNQTSIKKMAKLMLGEN